MRVEIELTEKQVAILEVVRKVMDDGESWEKTVLDAVDIAISAFAVLFDDKRAAAAGRAAFAAVLGERGQINVG